MPADPRIFSLLRKTAAFRNLAPERCEQVAARMQERTLLAGETLAREGEQGDSLFLVVSGGLEITRNAPDAAFLTDSTEHMSPPRIVGSAHPGEVVGELGLLTGHIRNATFQSTEPTTVAILTRASFNQLSEQAPEAMAPSLAWLAAQMDLNQITTAIEESPLLRRLGAAAKDALASAFARVEFTAGETLFHQGQPGDALYLILSGRIRILRRNSSPHKTEVSTSHILADLGKGEVFGELALLTGEFRSASALALRDSHLARLDRQAFERIVADHPTEILGLFSRQLALRLQDQNQEQGKVRRAEGRPPVAIAILPLTPMEQTGGARDFTSELVRQLSAFGPTLHLNRSAIDRIFPELELSFKKSTPLNEGVQRRLFAWLDDMEMLYRHVIYEADYQTGYAESAWTSRCLRQADTLLVIAGAPSDPQKSEQAMHRLTHKAIPNLKTTLVLIHDQGPGSVLYTRAWKSMMGIQAHEHIRRNNAADVARIARALNRQSVGLVLGGGFALGLAHIGVVDAMRELQIPIDYVGGTSMGAIIAAACAQEFTHDQMLEVMDKGCAQALKGDYTLPIVSLLTGKKVTSALGEYLEGLDIEDLWLPYFAISASLTQARMIVHREGSALRSVVASCRAPGMFPPLGWNGDVLVDGGLVNNVPADVMRESIGSGTVFAIDVSPETEFIAGKEFGLELSGWRVARRNGNPFRRQPKIGTIADVLMRLIRMGGVSHRQQIRDSADLYMTIPLEQFSVRDFARGEEMARAGHDHAIQQLQSWIAEHGRPWLGDAVARAEIPDHPPA